MKKIAAILIGAGAVIAAAPLFSAFEAPLTNVTAAIQSVLGVSLDDLSFGTVFPQEKLDRRFDLTLSQSFMDAYNATTGIQYATSVIAYAQGVRKNGSPVLPDRSDPADALGAPESSGAAFDSPVVSGSYFSLGFSPTSSLTGGWIVLGFENFIVNETGTDLTIFEVTGGPPYPDEKVFVEAAQATSGPWITIATSAVKDASLDLGVLPWARFLRITDVSDRTLFEPTADGYDLDGVRATSRRVIGGDIAYALRQQPKCANDLWNPTIFSLAQEDDNGIFSCPTPSHVLLPVLCPYLSKHEVTADGAGENDGAGIPAFHGLPGLWTESTTFGHGVEGLLSMITGDQNDSWNIDFRVPCYRGECAQDWAGFVKAESGDPNINADNYVLDPAAKGKMFGCDLWIEVLNVVES